MYRNKYLELPEWAFYTHYPVQHWACVRNINEIRSKMLVLSKKLSV